MDNYTPETTVDTSVAVEEKKPFAILGLISMICGILAILIGCCCAIAGILLGIVAVVLAIIERVKMGKFSGFALAGLICGGVGLVASLANSLLGLLGTMGSAGGTGYYY